MKMKQVLIAGAFVGAFGLGALFAPIGEPTATTGNNNGVIKAVNTTTEQVPNEDTTGYTCPMTGQPMNGNCAERMGQNGQGGWFNKNVTNNSISNF